LRNELIEEDIRQQARLCRAFSFIALRREKILHGGDFTCGSFTCGNSAAPETRATKPRARLR
jgi:hypothetical protein